MQVVLFFSSLFLLFFFFKQKTAYEMRISDWSSDVCSSDLAGQQIAEMPRRGALGGDVEQVEIAGREALARLGAVVVDRGQRRRADAHGLGRAQLIVHQRDQRADDEDRKSTRLNSSH